MEAQQIEKLFTAREIAGLLDTDVFTVNYILRRRNIIAQRIFSNVRVFGEDQIPEVEKALIKINSRRKKREKNLSG